MRVYVAAHWTRKPLPDGIAEDQVQDLTAEQILALFEAGYDVLLTHRSIGPSLFLDDPGRMFRQR